MSGYTYDMFAARLGCRVEMKFTSWSDGQQIPVVMYGERSIWYAEGERSYGWKRIGDWAVQRLAFVLDDRSIIDPEWEADHAH